VADYLVAATVEGVLAQRLVRRICDNCRVEYEPTAESVAALSGQPVLSKRMTRGAGCPECRGTGFRGRVGVFELLLFTDELREAVMQRAPRARVRAIAQETGLVALRTDGWEKARAGLTTVEEVLRVIQD
jgi:type II secretory ATPase GspE/PulE/Tfp pilus assembly ATPase PilB-like protein